MRGFDSRSKVADGYCVLAGSVQFSAAQLSSAGVVDRLVCLLMCVELRAGWRCVWS